MLHCEIRIPFTVDGRDFVAVGFLREYEGEHLIAYEEMFKRVPKIIGEEDTIFLEERRDRVWSSDLGDYHLNTGRRDPGGDDCIFESFVPSKGGGHRPSWSDIRFNCGKLDLAVCRA